LSPSSATAAQGADRIRSKTVSQPPHAGSTRPPNLLLMMTAAVSAVGCMPLSGSASVEPTGVTVTRSAQLWQMTLACRAVMCHLPPLFIQTLVKRRRMVFPASGDSPVGTTISCPITMTVSPWMSTDSISLTKEAYFVPEFFSSTTAFFPRTSRLLGALTVKFSAQSLSAAAISLFIQYRGNVCGFEPPDLLLKRVISVCVLRGYWGGRGDGNDRQEQGQFHHLFLLKDSERSASHAEAA
jgi:hypothetical protein